jgi:hypothetical protein
LNVQLLKVRAPFGKEAEEEEEKDGAGYILVGRPAKI